MAKFKGPIVHPQKWPEDLDYKNKRVIVIGSGATAATLIPAMANDCAHVTMLQRSPTYFRTGRNAIEIAEQLRQLQVDEKWIHEITRRKILFDQDTFTRKDVRGTGSGQEGSAVRGRSLSRQGLRHRDPLHAKIPAVAAAHRLHSRWRFVPGHQVRQGLRRHRRDRPLHREGHPAEIRQGAGGRHHRHRDRLPPLAPMATSTSPSTARSSISPTP